MTFNDLHQLPESHPISHRGKISLAHIDTPSLLRAAHKRIKEMKKKSEATNKVSSGNFEIGQTVRTRRNETGQILSIESGKISIEINGSARVFVASMLTAA